LEIYKSLSKYTITHLHNHTYQILLSYTASISLWYVSKVLCRRG
jgi:hypothetical protein